ncbi:MAG: gliding motility-associated C-terminal domain-containing protein [Sediminibacterium sp.]|nr:gliding motility-associated C-terminal domain-containing protein [Sediminibacterium sp.]
MKTLCKVKLNYFLKSSFFILLLLVLGFGAKAQETAQPIYNADSSVLTYFQFQKLRKIKIVNFSQFNNSVDYTKWYKNTTATYENATLVPDYTLDTLIPLSNEVGSTSYYVVIYFKNCECKSTSNIKTIQVLESKSQPEITQQPAIETLNFCAEQALSPLKINLKNEQGFNYQVQWYMSTSPDYSSGIPVQGASNLTFEPKAFAAGNHRYYFATVKFDQLNTTLTSKFSGEYNIHENPTISLVAQQIGTEALSKVVVTPTTFVKIKAVGAQKYTWFQDNDAAKTEDAESQFYVNQNTSISVVGTDQFGCKSESKVTFLVRNNNEGESVLLTNIISPNHDNINDFLQIKNPTGSPVKLKVYNPAGLLIYQNNNYNNNWHGTDINQAQLANGNYFYSIEIANYHESGNLSIVK